MLVAMQTTATSINTVKAAMYLRQSLDSYGNEVRVGDQRADLTRLCVQRAWPYTEYKDNDFGASVRMPGSAKMSKKRPAFTRMVADVKAGRINAIVVWDADRLVRHPREGEDIIDLADVYGVQLVTFTGDFDLSTPSGRANFRMKCVFARMEMEQKAMRQKDANGKRAEAERAPWWPSRPFGYAAPADRDTGLWWTVKRIKGQPPRFNTISKHPTEAKLLREAYRRFNAGTTLRTIANDWNKGGVTTPRGNRWTGAQVRALLLAARNAGLREYRGTVIGTGTWPAVVTQAVWEQAVRTLSDPARSMGAPRVRKYLLSGIARCGLCQSPVLGHQ